MTSLTADVMLRTVRRQINQFHLFKIEQSLLERFDISPEENSWVATKAK